MSIILAIAACIAIFVSVILVVDAATGLLRAARGIDEGAVERRLLEAQPGSLDDDERIAVLRDRQTSTLLQGALGPLFGKFAKFVDQSKIGLSPERLLVLMGILTFATFFALVFVLPAKIAWIAVLFAPVIGCGSLWVFVSSARTKRRRAFEEQLPDAIDLIVRSLKIGHPVTSAISVIAREMPAPIGPEFARVAEEVSYGHDLPTAIVQMQDRVPAPDLSYFSMAIQIQQESGGNLVESLQKLASVVRDRYRMFRKVHAITAEGRFSAWALSLFPFIIGFALQVVRPDYYTQVAGEPWFPYIAVGVVVMLIVNVIMMRILTTIKV